MLASRISSTFSAFRSPEREKLKLPTNGGVVGDDDLRVHEVVQRVRRPARRALPAERRTLEHAPQQRDLPVADTVRLPLTKDLVDLRVVDHARDPAAALVHDLHEGGEDRARGEDGEAMRIRSRALPMCLATRCDSASPCSGQNQARTRAPSTSSGRGSTFPVSTTSPRRQSSSNASV